MPKNHARKKALADLKDRLDIKHVCAVALLDHPSADEREDLERLLSEYIDINTFAEALDYLRQQQADPRNHVMCETCGWTYGMVCPECPGCGCYSGQCSGWRHHEYAEDDPDNDFDSYGCQECGAGGGGDPYSECCCYEDDEEEAA